MDVSRRSKMFEKNNKMTKIVIIACGFAAALLVSYTGAFLRFTRIALLEILIFGIWVASAMPQFKRNIEQFKSKPIRRANVYAFITLVLFVIGKQASDSISIFGGVTPDSVICYINDSFALLACLLVFMSYDKSEAGERLASAGLGISIYCVCNVIAFSAGFVAPEVRSAAMQSTLTTITERMWAPFGPGLNNFGTIAASGFGLCALGGTILWRKHRKSDALIVYAGGVGCLNALRLVEMRASMVAVLFVLVYHGLGKNWLRSAAVCMVVFLPVIVPLVATQPVTAGLLERAGSIYGLERLQRSSGDFASFGGRLIMWEYGLGMVFNGTVGWCGLGMGNRDAGVVAAAGVQETFGMAAFSFHNGFVESLVVYGPVMGILGLGLIVFCVLYTTEWKNSCKAPSAAGSEHEAAGCVGAICLLMSLNIFDAYVDLPIFWGLSCLCVANLTQIATGTIRAECTQRRARVARSAL